MDDLFGYWVGFSKTPALTWGFMEREMLRKYPNVDEMIQWCMDRNIAVVFRYIETNIEETPAYIYAILPKFQTTDDRLLFKLKFG